MLLMYFNQQCDKTYLVKTKFIFCIKNVNNIIIKTKLLIITVNYKIDLFNNLNHCTII